MQYPAVIHRHEKNSVLNFASKQNSFALIYQIGVMHIHLSWAQYFHDFDTSDDIYKLGYHFLALTRTDWSTRFSNTSFIFQTSSKNHGRIMLCIVIDGV